LDVANVGQLCKGRNYVIRVSYPRDSWRRAWGDCFHGLYKGNK